MADSDDGDTDSKTDGYFLLKKSPSEVSDGNFYLIAFGLICKSFLFLVINRT